MTTTTAPSPNLLLNPSNDEPLDGTEIPNWTEVQGDDWTRRSTTPAPLAGSAYFFAGATSQAELRQDVDVSGYAAYIDNGIQRFTFEGFVRSTEEATPDAARIVIEYRDAANATVLANFDSGEIARVDAWQQVAELTAVPPGTRIVRVRLISRRMGGTSNNAYFDALSLRSLGTPVLAIDDPSVFEADFTSVDLVFDVSLTCADDETVTVDFATAEIDATAGVDYVSTSGTVVFPPGSTSQPITVEILGDTEEEAHETLSVNLSLPTVAVFFRDQGVGRIFDDETEPLIDLTLEKVAVRRGIRPDELLDFTLQVHNRGLEAPLNVVVTDVLPPHLVFDSASHGGMLDAGTVTWNIASIAPQATVALTLTVRGEGVLPFGTTVTNTAAVTDDGTFGPDQNPDDNTAEEQLVLWDAATPLVDARPAHDLIEGGIMTLAPALFYDSSASETHTATIDWGDGTVEAGTLSESGGNGSIAGSHTYQDDLDGAIEVCVTDSAGNTGCHAVDVTVANDEPAVLGNINLNDWVMEEYATGSDQGTADWDVSDDGLTVFQRINSRPSVFYGDFGAFGTRIKGKINAVSNRDDDFIGFVLGYRPGDNLRTSDVDFLLIDWKRRTQSCARVGLAVSRITGRPGSRFCSQEFWNHASTSRFQELARASTLGSTGYTIDREYEFEFEINETRLRIWVDGNLEFDIAGTFRDGRLGFYNHSQPEVVYSAFTVSSALINEGEVADFEASFTDPGALDTHTATIDWRDGSPVEPGVVVPDIGGLPAVTGSPPLSR